MARYGDSVVMYERSWGTLPAGVSRGLLIGLEAVVSDSVFWGEIGVAEKPYLDYVRGLVRQEFDPVKLTDAEISHLACSVYEVARSIAEPKVTFIKDLKLRLEEAERIARIAYNARNV
ncbi:hypothetical protein HYU11_02480 [Candidatus Woesearchaeota archaeon]|nr:hypothetical protein [Candidatus Woesearchaeota archaeon]